MLPAENNFEIARKLITEEFGELPEGVRSALTAYIDASELYHSSPKVENYETFWSAQQILEKFCAIDVDCRTAHSRVSEAMHAN